MCSQVTACYFTKYWIYKAIKTAKNDLLSHSYLAFPTQFPVSPICKDSGNGMVFFTFFKFTAIGKPYAGQYKYFVTVLRCF